MTDPEAGADALAILRRGLSRGVPVEAFGPVWSSARLRLSRAGWQGATLEPFLNQAVPYASTSSGRLSEDAVAVALAALPGRDGLRILELGAGSGVFARLFLDALRGRAPAVYDRSTYVVTDGSPGILAAQEAAGVLAPHAGRVERRVLDLAAPWPDLGRFDLILGSYILDSLPFDFLALNDTRVWRRELRAYLPEDRADLAARLAQALAEGDAALAPFVTLGPELSSHTRHVAVDRAALPRAADLPADTGGETVPFIHCHGALDCIDTALAHLTEGGIAIFSDYGHLEPYRGRQDPEFQTYGTSVAVGLNFPQVEAALAGRAEVTLFRPTEEDGHLYTRVLRRGDGPDLTDIVDDLYGALRARALQVTVDAAREALRGRLYESARRFYGLALERQPRNWALMQEIAARLHLPADEAEDALAMAELGLTLNPLSPDLWRTAAEAHLAAGRTGAAQAAAGRAVALAPSNPAAQLALAQAAHRLGDHAGALRAIAAALIHDEECDLQDAALAVQAQVLADMARARIRVLRAAVNPFRAQDGLPDGDTA